MPARSSVVAPSFQRKVYTGMPLLGVMFIAPLTPLPQVTLVITLVIVTPTG